MVVRWGDTTMRLTADEQKELQTKPRVLVWRAMEKAPHTKTGHTYRTHQVLSTDEPYTRQAIVSSFGTKMLLRLDERFGTRWRVLWLTIIVPVDEVWPLLAYGGLGDEHGYTDRPRRTKTGLSVAMVGEPPAVPRAIVDGYAAAAQALIASKQRARHARKKRAKLRTRNWATQLDKEA
jgi:hypothetical protein